MRKHIKTVSISIIFQCLFLAGLYTVALTAEKPTLEDIAFKTASASEEQITFKLNGTYIPKFFAIKGKKPRIVFDFPEILPAPTLSNIIKTNGKFIQQIRIGIHRGENPKTRVVLDLVADKEINFDQDFDQQKKNLTISVYSATTAAEKSLKKATAPITEAKPEKPADKAPAPPPVKVEQPAPEQVPPSPPVPPPTVAEKSALPVPQPKIQSSPEPVDYLQPKTKIDEPPTLLSVKFDNSSNRGEMIQFKLNDFYPPVVFGIEEGSPRVVCDFKNTRADASLKETITTNGSYVRTIRIGKHKNPNKIRVVIDLEPNNNYDLQQVFFKEDNMFVIIVNIMHNSPPVTDLEKPLKE